MIRMTPSTAAERSPGWNPHVLVAAKGDVEDREWVTLTCWCEWTERVRKDAAMPAFCDHSDTNIRSPESTHSGTLTCTSENGVAPALVEQPGARTRPNEEVMP